MTVLEKATLLKEQKLEGKKKATPCSEMLLPTVELMEIAAEGAPPLPRKDAMQLAVACGISELDLNMVSSGDDV
ncbi:hypothetical protein D1007_48260 [Hordeum vulgare]|nr:hypothetical protein D1007_48260 [Hordeum vulgare]